MATIVVTGANRGIGLELARQLSERGDTVIAVVRKASDALSDLGVEIIDGVDVTDPASVARFADALTGRQIDILINNAGILSRQSLDTLDYDEMRRQFEVNALGVLRVTTAALPCLGSGSKVAIVSSRMGSMEDNTSGSHYGYRMSKAAVNMAGRSLAHDLKDQGITVVLLHPGYVATDMTDHKGDTSPDEAARGLIARIDEAGADRSGSFWHANGTELPW